MGFGWLFIGSVIGINFVYNGFTDIISFLLILYALLLLSRHNKYFKSSLYAIIPLCIAGLCFFVFEFLTILDIELVSNKELIYSYYAILSAILKLIYTALLLKGIETLAFELDIPNIRVRAFRNRLFIYLYYVLQICTELNNEAFAKFARYAILPVMLFGFVCLILNAVLFYSCYMWICLEGDEDMERKESKFSFLNKLHNTESKIEERIVNQKEAERHSKEQNKNKRKKK